MNSVPLASCRVCGYKFDAFRPWGKDATIPSFYYCPCCFVEFGFDDVNESIIQKQRRAWIMRGFDWYEPSKMPQNWSPVEQLKNIGVHLTQDDIEKIQKQ